MIFLQCSNRGGGRGGDAGGGVDRAGRAGQRRRHLLEVARALFVEQGFHGTGVAQIAAASGVKVGQIYRDFAGKEDIIAAIVLRDLSGFLDEDGLARAIETGDVATIRAWILALVGYDADVDGYRLVPEIAAESARNERIARLQDEMNDRVRGTLMRALAACAPGDDRAAAREEFADLITTLGIGLCQWTVVGARRGQDVRPLYARMRAILARELDALCAAPARPTGLASA